MNPEEDKSERSFSHFVTELNILNLGFEIPLRIEQSDSFFSSSSSESSLRLSHSNSVLHSSKDQVFLHNLFVILDSLVTSSSEHFDVSSVVSSRFSEARFSSSHFASPLLDRSSTRFSKALFSSSHFAFISPHVPLHVSPRPVSPPYTLLHLLDTFSRFSSVFLLTLCFDLIATFLRILKSFFSHSGFPSLARFLRILEICFKLLFPWLFTSVSSRRVSEVCTFSLHFCNSSFVVLASSLAERFSLQSPQ